MRRAFVISGLLACFLLSIAAFLQASGILPAIVPALVPTANKTSTTSTVFALASSSALTASSPVCTNANGDMTTTACTTNAVTSTTPVTANANSTADQQLMELSLSAGYLNSLGRPFDFFGAGVYTTQAGQTPTLELKVKLCTVSGCGSGTVVTLADITTAATTANSPNVSWNLDVLGTNHATGATGNLEVHGNLTADLGNLISVADTIYTDTNTAVSANIDLTAALFVDWTVKFSTQPGTPFNAMTQREGVVNPGGSTSGGGGTSAVTQISQNVLSGAAASVTFSGIAGTFTDLMISMNARGDAAAGNINVGIQVNGDAGTNYDDGNFLSSGTFSNTGQTQAILCIVTAATATANFSSGCEIRLYNYARTTFFKPLQGISSGFVSAPNEGLSAGLWKSTAAITSVTILPSSGNFITGSTFTLWGIT